MLVLLWSSTSTIALAPRRKNQIPHVVNFYTYNNFLSYYAKIVKVFYYNTYPFGVVCPGKMS